MNKKYKRVLVHFWTPRDKRLFYLKNVVLVAIIFAIGILVGDGKIGFISSGSNGSLNNGLPNQLNYSSVNKVYQALKNNYDGKITQTEVLNGVKHGIAESVNDPYTEYFTAAEAKSFNGELNNSFSGIGAELSQDSSGELEIIAPVTGSPAAKAGLQAKDVIAAINGKSTSGLSVDNAVDAIRGKPGTKVSLEIIRGSQTLNLTITRQNINAPSVNTKILPGNIGYIQISTFADDTSTLAEKAATQFKKDDVKGIILDLRENPGGLVTAAVNVSSLWLKPGQTVMQERRGTKVIDTEYALGGNILNGIPTVVLIDSGSASASEITAGALHDNGDAYLIGERSFGKGVVQAIVCITGQESSSGNCPADELKVTVASWYRPDGQDIEHIGIKPDKTVNLSPSDINSDNDTQLQAAESYLNNK